MRWISDVVETPGTKGMVRRLRRAIRRSRGRRCVPPPKSPPLTEDIRLQCGDQALGVRFIEQDQHDRQAECSDHFARCRFRDDGRSGALSNSDDASLLTGRQAGRPALSRLEVARMATCMRSKQPFVNTNVSLVFAAACRSRTSWSLVITFTDMSASYRLCAWMERDRILLRVVVAHPA